MDRSICVRRVKRLDKEQAGQDQAGGQDLLPEYVTRLGVEPEPACDEGSEGDTLKCFFYLLHGIFLCRKGGVFVYKILFIF